MKINEAKARLDLLIDKARVDLYKPIQIAEVLHYSRVKGGLRIHDVETYRNRSIGWRDKVTWRLLGKASTSSARFQHDLWNNTAMPPKILSVLDKENRDTNGLVERYIYMRFAERQSTIGAVMAAIDSATPKNFHLEKLLELFVRHRGIRRSIDKAYEIVTYTLFETVVTSLGATVRVRVPDRRKDLLREFQDLAAKLLGLRPGEAEWEQVAHIYRVGVTKASDRGLDMWANFGPAVQVKHLTLDTELAKHIVGQVESDRVIVVCRDADADVIRTVANQIAWGSRVRAIVVESELVGWYDKCLRGKFAAELGGLLLKRLSKGFEAEFPQNTQIEKFMKERKYTDLAPVAAWLAETDKAIASKAR